MKIIELKYRGNGIAQLILGGAIIVGAYFLWSSSVGPQTLFFLCLSIGVFGVAFIFLGLKSLRSKPLPIKYGEGEVWLPENIVSKNYAKIKVNDIKNVSIKSHVPRYIKTLEVSSSDAASSISLEAIPSGELGALLRYLEAPQC